ncbi:hypothetical protein HanPI659440_Chr01g0020791 [Helianthus annuus]|nr:hypothetical protein HanPI659440_Chr01g0020791 [Helianthus annuus]
MNHLWICLNKLGRDIVPYCRIITGLMKQQKALTSEDRGHPKRHQPFTLQKLGIGWTYTLSERYHKLKSEGQRWRALKVDARALLSGEADEPESDAEQPSGDEDYEDEPHGGVNVNVGQGGPGGAHGGAFYDYTERSYEQIGLTMARWKRLSRINVLRHLFSSHGQGRSGGYLISTCS